MPRASAHTVFHTSMLPSGTRNTREMLGLSSGSSRSACAGSISSQSTPVSRHPWANTSAYAGSSNGVVTKNPPTSSIESGVILFRMRFSAMHSSAARGSLTA